MGVMFGLLRVSKKSFLGFCAVSLGNSKGVLGYNPPKLVKFIKSLWSRV